MVVELRVLGPLEIVIAGTVSQPGRAQVRRVLALLAAAEGRWVSRDLLEVELWPDVLPRDPRAALHVAVNRARSVFGGAGHDVIVSASDGYRLAEGDVVLDLASWRERIAEAATRRSAGDLVAATTHLRAAQGLWRGEPFADVTGSERIDAVRHGLVREHEDVELLRVELLTAAGRVAEAAALGVGLAAEGVVREDVVVAAMRALRLAGRSSEALRLGDRFRTTLREDVGLAPSHRLDDEERAALRPSAPATPPGVPVTTPSPSRAPLAARRAVAADALAGALREHLVAGTGGHTSVTAEPGGGRTTFLAAVVDRVRAGDRPPEVIAVAGATATLRDVVPHPLPAADRQAELLGAVEHLVADAPHGLVVVVDDAHLVDDWSRQLLRALRRPRPGGVVVVTAEPDPGPAGGNPDDDVAVVALPPLDEDEVRAALRARWPELGGARALRWATAIHRWCGGNALWTELAIRDVDPRGEPGDLGVPSSAATTIRRTVSHLDEATRDLLRIAAVLGPRIDPELVASIAGRTVVDAVAMLGSAAGHGIVDRSTTPGRWVFRHELVAQALAATVDEATAVAWKATAGLALADVPGRRPDAADLLVAAVPVVDRERAMETAALAGDELLERNEHERAVTLYGAALELAGPGAPSSLRLRRADALDRAGRPEEAQAAYQDAMDRADDDDHATLVAAALGGGGHGGVIGGRIGRRRRLGLAFRRLPPGHPDRGRVAAEYALELVNGRATLEPALLEVVEAEAADETSPGWLMARRVCLSLDEIDGRADLAQADDLARATLAGPADPVEAAAGLAVAVGVATSAGRWTTAEAWADELERLGRRAGVARAHWQAEAFRTALHEGRGATDEADASAQRALHLGQRLDIADAEATLGLHMLGRALRVGSLAPVAPGIAGAADRYHYAIWSMLSGLAELDAGREGPARDRLRTGGADVRHERDHFRAATLALGALLAARLGDRDAAAEMDAALAAGSWVFAVIGYGGPCVGPTAWYRAVVADVLGRAGEAATHRARAHAACATAGARAWTERIDRPVS